MECTTLTFLSIWIIFLGMSKNVGGQGGCKQHLCGSGHYGDARKDKIFCGQSRILISNVTNKDSSNTNQTVLTDVKRKCMGQSSCTLDKECPPHSNLVVHYECVNLNASQFDKKECSLLSTSTKFGHIQSEGYPEEKKSPTNGKKEYFCHWKVNLTHDQQLVVISILDIQTSGSNEECDAGLVISGKSCKDQVPASRNLCSREAGRNLMYCGNVDIKLRRSQVVFPLRFWLYFELHPNRIFSTAQSNLSCLASVKTQAGSGSSSGHMKKPSLTDILIILLSIISGISIVLFIILIVFCIRWRSLQMQRSESLYNYQDMSPGLQAHYEYISSLEPELDKNRPELVDGYFEVADALPVQERGATPTSPAYAEVEQVAQMRRLIFTDEPLSTSSYSDGTCSLVTPGLRDSMANQDNADTGNEGTGKNDAQFKEPGSHNSSFTDIASKNAGARPKRTVLERLKGVPGMAFGEKDKKLIPQGDVSPKLSSSRNIYGQSARSLLKGKTNGTSTTRQKIGRLFGSREDVASRDIPDTTSEAGSEPAYEMVEEFVPLSVSKHGIKAKLKTGGEKTLPVLPSTSPPDGSQKKPNQKLSNKQQDIPNNNHDYVNSPSASSKRHLETKAEKPVGARRERANFYINQKSKVASSPFIEGAKSAKPKGAKSPTVFSNGGKQATTGKPPGLSNKASTPVSSCKFSSDSKFEAKKKTASGSLSDTSQTKNNNYKPTAIKDIPHSKGIVKNGIQRFEQSSSTSNE